METAHRRTAAMAMGTLPRFAGGGLIEGFKKAIGITPESPELKAYKERAAAERSGKAAAPAAQTMAAPPKSAIGDYVGNSALDKRMKAADAMASGGPIKGPGTGTSDDVLLWGSNGEFMVRKAAVDVVGTEVLEAINALGEDQSTADDPEDKQPGKYAVGGLVNGSTVNRFGSEVGNTPEESQRLANQTSSYVAGAKARAPAQQQMAAPAQPAPAAPQQSEYARQMGEVGNFFANGASAAVKTLVSAPGYGLSSQAPAVAATSTPAPSAAPAQPVAPVAPAVPAVASAPRGAPATSPNAPNPASGSPDQATDGVVTRKGNSFSGQNISGDVRYADGTASKGSVSVVPGMSQAAIDKTLTNPDGSRWSEADNATMAANIRDGVDPMRGTQRGMAEEKMARLQNLALSPNGTPGKSNALKILSMQSDERRTAATQQTERDKLAVTTKGAELDNAGKQQTLDAQRALTEAKTPEEKKSALEVLAGLQGRVNQTPQEEYAYAPGGQEVVGNQLVTRPGVIFNKRTGEVLQQGAQKAKAPPSAGEVVNGYRFKGGNPADQKSWEKV